MSVALESRAIQSSCGCDAFLFQAASFLTYPVCKSHELYRRSEITETLYPLASKIEIWARKFFLYIGILLSALIALVVSMPGIALRYIASSMQEEPFIYYKGEAQEIPLQSGEFSLLSWNICCVSGGYAISDGGVLPWTYRIDDVIKKIQAQKADVLCLYELFDADASFYLYEKLKHEYAHFYLNIGPRAVGVSSGMFVASKFPLDNPEFVPFPKEMLVGRTKNAEKGIFSFDVQNVARVFSTHLQHSEECAYPTSEEIDARKNQMEMVIERVNKVKNKCAIVTGDLNLDDQEYIHSKWSDPFQKGVTFIDQKTWGGDGFCAALMQKKSSGPLNLDHTMILKGSAKSITTFLVDANFDGKIFKQDALSDHSGLLSHIVI